ncbi:unnamed protein product [Ilex paraguariensis]|uniref:Glycolipid transfer protein domain-containing protein n=1 Tax=Ilex paraguariensis TaxID=185542 RepID=A0ABC8S9X1_9AQUA
MKEDDAFEDAATGTPLSAIAEAFEDLSGFMKSSGSCDELRLKPFCDACSLVSILFGCLGIAFKFAEMEYVSKSKSLKAERNLSRPAIRGLPLIHLSAEEEK